jgi:UDP-N-acetylglucosamine--N-acetylmuramyl-(pentapeptide) pyrophosphoryl-undecaprenol N-acetylglucosamine transferase
MRMQRRTAGAGRTLLVASTGGHLEQLSRLRRRFAPAAGEVEWVTFDDAQARSLLAGETVHVVPYIPPRGYGAVARALPAAVRLLRAGRFDRVVSTGAGIALAFIPVARALGVEAHYVESSARASGPSLTGRLISHVPGVHLYSQYPAWAAGPWQYEGSLFDGYDPVDAAPGAGVTAARRVVVTLGTMRTYGFRRAVEHLVRVLPEVLAPDAQVLWQVGVTDVAGLGIDARADVPAAELHAAIAAADLVIAHSGIGSCLIALDAGRCPVLLPRRHELGEHVDGHQQMIADELDRRGLAVSRAPEELVADDLRAAMGRSIEKRDVVQPFRLATAG